MGQLFRLLAVVSCYSIFLLKSLKGLKNALIGECTMCGNIFFFYYYNRIKLVELGNIVDSLFFFFLPLFRFSFFHLFFSAGVVWIGFLGVIIV